MDLELHFAKALSNAEKSYVSNVGLDEWTNIGFHDFLSCDNLGFQKLILSCENFKFQNLNHLNFVKCKVDQNTLVDLDEFNNLGTHHFCI